MTYRRAMSARIGNASGGETARNSAIDALVVATVNAPYKRSITAETLAACIVKSELAGWTAHIANFFTDVDPEVILAFAEIHGISTSQLAHIYQVVKSTTGECNPDLESALASLAPAA
jgi:hypothetical protein